VGDDLRAEKPIALPEPLKQSWGQHLAWDGRSFWVALGARVCRLDLSSREVLNSFVAPAEVKGLAWDGLNFWIASGTFEGEAQLWVVDTRGRVWADFPSPALTTALAWNKDRLWMLGAKEFGGNAEVYKLNVAEPRSYVAGLAERAKELSLQGILQVVPQPSEGPSAMATLEIANETAEELTIVLEGFGTVTLASKEKVTRLLQGRIYVYKAHISGSLSASGRYALENGFRYTWVFSLAEGEKQ